MIFPPRDKRRPCWYGPIVNPAERPVVEVRDLLPHELAPFIDVLARGMRDNPMHVAALGTDPEQRRRLLHRLFTGFFRAMPTQTPLVAVHGLAIVGGTGVAPPGSCQPGGAQRLRLLPTMLAVGPRRLVRINSWMSTWAKRDLEEPHVHLGPLAVDAPLQGRGIGTQILREHTRRLDASGVVGYLETDKEENVRLYERHGYEVIGEQSVLGVPNWFMRREPMEPDAA